MIYDKLRTLPKVVQIEIIQTGDVSLLSDEGTPVEELTILWENLMEEFKNIYDDKNQNKLFSIYKEIEFLQKKYTCIKLAVEALEFDVNEQLINMLIGFGYRLNVDTYKFDLERILRESEGINLKINKFIDQLPKQQESEGVSSYDIIDLMAIYSSILNIDFDYNTVSVVKFHALEKQVKQKIASIEKNNPKK
jgi:hypothetical protein